jgi:hypothetical protein
MTGRDTQPGPVRTVPLWAALVAALAVGAAVAVTQPGPVAGCLAAVAESGLPPAVCSTEDTNR